jgi:hypothetical protein
VLYSIAAIDCSSSIGGCLAADHIGAYGGGGETRTIAKQLGLQLGRNHHIDNHAAGREKPGDHARQEQLADRHFGQHAPHDHP